MKIHATALALLTIVSFDVSALQSVADPAAATERQRQKYSGYVETCQVTAKGKADLRSMDCSNPAIAGVHGCEANRGLRMYKLLCISQEGWVLWGQKFWPNSQTGTDTSPFEGEGWTPVEE
jgi:hypothetical protein